MYSFLFKQREVRGVLCDVWVASRGTQRGYFSTVEVFLSHKNWSVEMEVLNHVQRVPIGVATYLTPAVSKIYITARNNNYYV